MTYHAGFSQTPGGFVGVDVFFVISGFLICGIIRDELAKGRFSLLDFYERRARRILPALFAVLAATSVAAAFILAPIEVVRYGQSLAAAVLSVSNFFFGLTFDYFDAGAHSAPLLHTWSLAVEEQFYLIVPLLLVFLARRSRRSMVVGLSAIALVSFAWSIWGVHNQPTVTFYLLHTRAWELAVGALLAIAPIPNIQARVLRETIAVAGLAAITCAVLFFSKETPFPGLAALAPCLGAAALIYVGAGGQTVVGRLLSNPGAVFVGLISYSLYLWHWPVIVLSRAGLLIGDGWDPKLEKLALVAISLGLAVASWWWVERPFRNREWLDRRAIFSLAGIGAITLCAVGAAFILAQGFPQRMDARANAIASTLGQKPELTLRSRGCMVGTGLGPKLDQAACLTSVSDKPNVLLLGDSHAGHLWSGLSSEMPAVNLLQAAAGGCRPIWPSRTSDRICEEFRTKIFGSWLTTHPPDLVVLAGRWEPKDVRSVGPTLDYLKSLGLRVVLVGPSPRYLQELPRLVLIEETRRDFRLTERQLLPETAGVDRKLREIAAQKGVPYVSLYRAICLQDGSCISLTPSGSPLLYDSGHFTVEGSKVAGQAIAPAVLAGLVR